MAEDQRSRPDGLDGSGEPLPDSVPELQRRVRDLRVLQDFSRTLLDHRRDIDDILWDVACLAVARLDLEDCVIYLVDTERGDLVQRAAHGPKNPREREILNPIRLPVGRGIVGSVAATGRVELVRDTRQDPRYVADDEVRLSELAVPIFHDGRVIGVIDSEHSRQGFFTDWHRDLFMAIGTSGQVHPAAGFVAEVAGRARTVELNLEPGAMSRAFDARIEGPASETVPAFLATLLRDDR